MALTTTERERIKYHLGYLGVNSAASIQLGIPRPVQTLFLVESAMSQLITDNEANVRRIVGVLDDIECKLIGAQDRLSAKRLEDIELRDGEPDLLEAEYVRWAGRLADILGVPFYAYSQRFRGAGGVVAGSIPVRKG